MYLGFFFSFSLQLGIPGDLAVLTTAACVTRDVITRSLYIPHPARQQSEVYIVKVKVQASV